METITLRTGTVLPMEGFGVFRVKDKDECQSAVYEAIRSGYRLIDTAANYTNEDAVGRAIAQAIDDGLCTREELRITSKLCVQDMKNVDTARQGIDASLKALGLEYLDLYLLHQAMGDYFSAWRALEAAQAEGKIRDIGVSNFYPHVLTNFCETVQTLPVLNQIETHPFYIQQPALDTMKYYGIVPEAWAPLGGGRYNAASNPVLSAIADRHHKSVSQVMLRWNVQRGVIVLPKSVHAERIQENILIWDFTLSDEEMAQISSLDMGYTGDRVKQLTPDFIRMRIHEVVHP